VSDGGLLPGRATPEGCRAWAEARHRADPSLAGATYRRLGRTDLTVAKLGFGGYRTDAAHGEHRQALYAALVEGCNLLDTSTNYMDGGSERLFGEVLRQVAAEGLVGRDQVVVVSKAGYIQGGNLRRARERQQAGEPFPEVVEYAEGCWHCIHPHFLADQLDRSLARLGLESLDCLLLHNPEYYLADARQRGSLGVEAARDEFYERVQRAFLFFELMVREGRIGWYGVSSNTLPAPRDDFSHVDLASLWEAAQIAAREVHGDATQHHFGIIQFPYNLLESGALNVANTQIGDQTVPVTEAARYFALGTLVNRPLNAMHPNGTLLRLATPDPQEDLGDLRVALEEALQEVAAAESDIDHLLAEHGVGERFVDGNLFCLSRELHDALPQIQGVDHWHHIAGQAVLPNVNKMVRFLHRNVAGSAGADWERARDGYLHAVNRLLPAVEPVLLGRALAANEPLRRRLADVIGPGGDAMTLSQIALQFVASTPGVTTVLNGMRRVSYVTDATACLGMEDLPDVHALVAAMHE
jgi:aryl-alcohol dehydrogenase-like predicted oxidoreductase